MRPVITIWSGSLPLLTSAAEHIAANGYSTLLSKIHGHYCVLRVEREYLKQFSQGPEDSSVLSTWPT